MEASADILLLVMPDYTIYDEVRKTRDFQVFADMRLAGVGMIARGPMPTNPSMPTEAPWPGRAGHDNLRWWTPWSSSREGGHEGFGCGVCGQGSLGMVELI